MEDRHAIVGVSLAGMASMALVGLFQIGIGRRPESPRSRPHFDTANSEEAHCYGTPEARLSFQTASLALAAAGPPQRYTERAWLSVIASVLSGAQAAVGAKYLFYQVPYVDRPWCPYCIPDALTHLTTSALIFIESVEALEGNALNERGGRS